MIECVIFDCDGTLVDTQMLWSRALAITLNNLGIEITEQLLHNLEGKRAVVVKAEIESIFDVHLNDDFIESYISLAHNLIASDLRAIQGVDKALSSINLPKCVASSAPKEEIIRHLTKTDLAKYFAGNIVSSYDIGSWKPDPAIFLEAAKHMGYLPEKCAVVEDSMVGIEAAEQAGMSAFLYDPKKRFQIKSRSVLLFSSMEVLHTLINL